MTHCNPAAPVLAQSLRTPEGLALVADGVELSYAALVRRAAALAGALAARGLGHGARIGILGSRSLVAVEAVLAVAWCGATYVPLGLGWPAERLRSVLDRVGLDALIADARGSELAGAALFDAVRVLVVPSASARPRADALALDALPAAAALPVPVPMAADDPVYVIFTSGTTGIPKGVVAPARSVAAYCHALGLRKAMTPDDRASQFTELTFDPSIGEIYVPWYAGASLHVVPAQSQVSPARFIRERALTIWGSAPAAIAWLRNTRALQPGTLPTLRYSSFGGEPLPLAAVRAWQAAAPHSAVDNLYGPTEATVDCVGQYVAVGATPIVTPGRDVLAIGVAHPGTELAIFDADRRPQPDGVVGELAIAGAQLSLGYLDAPELTAQRFPIVDGRRWYLTGDLALRDAAGCHHHLGRLDNQIKIHGHRVELEDVEAHLRAVAGTDEVAVIAWPVVDGVASALVAFVAGAAVPPATLREALRGRLPAYMVPATIRATEELLRNAHGKVDRHALVARLAAEGASADGSGAA